MADIIAGTQRIRREIRLQVRFKEVRAIGGHLVLIGINEVRTILRCFEDTPHRIRREQIIVVAERDKFPRRHRQRGVCVARNAAILRAERHTEAIVLLRQRLQQFTRVRTGACAVIETGFPRAARLMQQRIRQRAQQLRRRIISRNEERQAHGRGEGYRKGRFMAADKGLVAVFLRLTQGGFRLEEGALTMARDAEPDGFGDAAKAFAMNAPDDAQGEEHDGNLLSMDDWLYYSIRERTMEGKARIKRDKHAGNVRQSAQLNRAEAIRRDFIRFIFPALTFLSAGKK